VTRLDAAVPAPCSRCDEQIRAESLGAESALVRLCDRCRVELTHVAHDARITEIETAADAERAATAVDLAMLKEGR
jgi:hypothetical protein